MRSIKKQIEKQFNHAIDTYDAHAIVQQVMAKQLCELLPENLKIENILEIGCGTGLFTRLLIERFPKAKIIAVDLAEKMVHKAKEQCQLFSQVQFFVADIEEVDLSHFPAFDLIISNAVIQWFQSKEETLAKLSKSLQPNGWFAASTFGPKTFCELQHLFQHVEQQLGLLSTPHLLPLSSSSSWQQMLTNAGLHQITSQQTLHRLNYEHCLAFLKGIKAVGASYRNDFLPLHISRKLLRNVIQLYDQKYCTSNGVYATYELLYLIGQRTK